MADLRRPRARCLAVTLAAVLAATFPVRAAAVPDPAPVAAVDPASTEAPEDGDPGVPASADAEATMTVSGGAGSLSGLRIASVGDSGNPYRAIVARNAFRLKDPLPPPPPPTNPPPPPEVPKVDVKLSGVGIINGVRYAYLVVPDGAKQGQFSYPSLTDDPKRGDTRYEGIEVKEIDLKKRTVRVVNGGLEVALNFKDNGVKGAAAPVQPGKPGVPAPGGAGGVNVPRPTTTVVVPAANNPPAPVAQEPQPVVFSRRGNRAANDTGVSSVPLTGVNAAPRAVTTSAGGGATTVNFPARPVRSDVSTPAAAVPQIPIEHQYEILLKQRQAYESVGVPLPPIPGLPVPTPSQ